MHRPSSIRFPIHLFAFLCALCGEIQAQQTEVPGDVRALVASARDRVFPALVNIDVVTLNYVGGKEEKHRSTGSGTIISEGGHVLTNAHVTDDGHRFWCVLADKQRIPATLVGEDPWTDLAVLKLDLSRLRDAKSLPTAPFGDSSKVAVGDYVLAMGSPFALSRTVTLGIVSNTERVFTASRGSPDEIDEMLLNWEQRTGLFTNWIQHDALINPGNSGGPLVNLRGEIVGVNTRGGSGMAFATPSAIAQLVAAELIQRGEVLRSSIGASFRHLEKSGLSEGVLIDSVDDDGPAHAAGLRAGDVVRSIGGTPVNVRFVEEIPPLLARIAAAPLGSALAIGFDRADSKGMTATITTEKLVKDKGEEAALRTWGLTGQEITDRMAKQRRLTSTRGVLVSSLRGGGPAATAEPALGWGDVIRSVDNQSVSNLKDLITQYERISALESKPEFVLIEFERDAKSFLTLIKPKPDDRPDPPLELPKAWIGVATQPVIKTMADKLGHPDKRGFRVMRVYSGTKAAAAGLKVGDLILALNSEDLAPRGLQDAGVFNRAIRKLSIDDNAVLKVYREGSVVDVPVILERTQITPEETPKARDTDFELVVRDITFFDRQDQRWEDSVSGVIVEQSEPAGWAGLGGVRPGDLIQRIGDSAITNLKSFKDAMKAIAKDQPVRVTFVVFRGSRTYFLFLEPDWKPTTSTAAPTE